MAFDLRPSAPRRIAIIGGGVTGLYAARLLAPGRHVTLFEAAPRLGGHARTVAAGRRGDRPVDTGFIVFNHANYPHLGRLFDELDVPLLRTDMSFGASLEGGAIEYGLRNPGAVFAQPSNALRPAFWGMIRDVLRFNRLAPAAARDDMTLAELSARLGLGRWFERHYLRPMCAAIWSTPAAQIGAFPARRMVRFFLNHGLMSVSGQHQWWTVAGGSISYVERLAADLRRRGVDLRIGAPVAAVLRGEGGVRVRAAGAEPERFDEVVFACHADVALRLLADAAPEERAALSAVRFQDNRAVLHADAALMPRRRKAWSAWNYVSGRGGGDAGVGVTYWMNRLQSIPEDDPLFVTLNPPASLRDELIQDETTFRHPVFDHGAIAAQERIAAMQGARGAWFAGAWLRHGFHEDGCATAARVARAIAARAERGADARTGATA
ncbi:NAD(P)/FAD-dependent oxidoreductase [Oceanicella actignis]|uniref:NAD(P)/FAD-dependent oxidoreductase n=1 Tax=Oceanicella actignis TaxID=1189325 RepID=UPI0011E75C97|nr:FAD-dependent oxidoreductase [Oceanicella actignis]TYO90449.1 putative NAD/FAD-binding protein [Oceanicella actignis]